MHDAFVFTYTCYGYVCAYLHAGVQLFHRHVLGWNYETLLRQTWRSSPPEDLAQLVFGDTQTVLGLCISGVKGKFWYCWPLMLPSFYWRQAGIFNCIAHGLWCGKLSQAPRWSDARLLKWNWNGGPTNQTQLRNVSLKCKIFTALLISYLSSSYTCSKDLWASHLDTKYHFLFKLTADLYDLQNIDGLFFSILQNTFFILTL